MGRGDAFVDVFSITTSAFGLRADWFQRYVPRMIQPGFALMALMLIVAIGIMALKRFENADLEKKVWNLPVLITIVMFWPSLVLGLKELVDAFNSFLVNDVFQIPWRGFGFPDLGSVTGIMGWSAEALARLLPNLAYWIIYAFYMINFFFLAVLGPLILAQGILGDEIEGFLDVVKELTILFLWQTTLIVLVAFLLPEMVSGAAFPARPAANFYFLSLILGVVIFFVPSMTRKFAEQVGRAFSPLGFRWGGAFLGLSLASKVAGPALAAAGMDMKSAPHLDTWRHRLYEAEEFKSRYDHRKHAQELKHENDGLESMLEHEQGGHEGPAEGHAAEGHSERGESEAEKSGMLALSKRARAELGPDTPEAE